MLFLQKYPILLSTLSVCVSNYEYDSDGGQMTHSSAVIWLFNKDLSELFYVQILEPLNLRKWYWSAVSWFLVVLLILFIMIESKFCLICL